MTLQEDRLFTKTVTMEKSRFGKGVYRYFDAPLPSLVEAVRWFVYPHVARIANAMSKELNPQQEKTAAQTLASWLAE